MGNESKIIKQIVRFSTCILFRVTADYVILMTLANYVETLADRVAKSKRTQLGYGTRKEARFSQIQSRLPTRSKF